jgi:hypothetical protein
MDRSCRLAPVGLIVLVAVLAAAGSSRAESRLQSLPALEPAVAEMKAQLGLSDAQMSQVEGLVVDRYEQVRAVVEEFGGGVSLDSVVDVLAEARSVRDDFVPALKGALTEEQRGRLAALPKAHEIYVAVGCGWLTEAYLDKLGRKVGLSAEQVADLRPVALGHFRDAVSIVEGVVAGGGAKKAMLDAVVDLRGVQRQIQRDVQRRLTDEQKARLEGVRKEADAASLERDRKGAAKNP